MTTDSELPKLVRAGHRATRDRTRSDAAREHAAAARLTQKQSAADALSAQARFRNAKAGAVAKDPFIARVSRGVVEVASLAAASVFRVVGARKLSAAFSGLAVATLWRGHRHRDERREAEDGAEALRSEVVADGRVNNYAVADADLAVIEASEATRAANNAAAAALAANATPRVPSVGSGGMGRVLSSPGDAN